MNNDLKNFFLTSHIQKNKIINLSLTKRIIFHPKMIIITLLIKFLNLFKFNLKITSKTFWSEDINLNLPEPVSAEILRFGFVEEVVINFILRCVKPGNIVVDVGAHYGFFSLLMHKIVGKNGNVYSFEPTPSTYKVLKTNSKLKNISSYNQAIWEKNENLYINDYGQSNSAFNSLKGSRDKNFNQMKIKKVKVKGISLDYFFEKNKITPNFIKIDAESAEKEVILGLNKTIKMYKPELCIELGDLNIDNTVKSKDIINKLMSFDYIPIEWNRDKLIFHEVKDNYKYCNLLFINKEKISNYKISEHL